MAVLLNKYINKRFNHKEYTAMTKNHVSGAFKHHGVIHAGILLKQPTLRLSKNKKVSLMEKARRYYCKPYFRWFVLTPSINDKQVHVLSYWGKIDDDIRVMNKWFKQNLQLLESLGASKLDFKREKLRRVKVGTLRGCIVINPRTKLEIVSEDHLKFRIHTETGEVINLQVLCACQ